MHSDYKPIKSESDPHTHVYKEMRQGAKTTQSHSGNKHPCIVCFFDRILLALFCNILKT